MTDLLNDCSRKKIKRRPLIKAEISSFLEIKNLSRFNPQQVFKFYNLLQLEFIAKTERPECL